MGWVFLHPLTSETVPTDTPTGKPDLDNSSLRLFSQGILHCIKLTFKTNQYRAKEDTLNTKTTLTPPNATRAPSEQELMYSRLSLSPVTFIRCVLFAKQGLTLEPRLTWSPSICPKLPLLPQPPGGWDHSRQPPHPVS